MKCFGSVLRILVTSGLVALFAQDPRAMAFGTESVIYSFSGGNDGADPVGSLYRNAQGNLFGTTYSGGQYGDGVVFKLDTAGVETILHAFGGQPSDGANPRAGIIIVNDKFYGTTAWGGRSNCAAGCGTIFSIDPATGREKLLHSFKRFKAELPGGVINVMGTLYGTTASG